MRGKSYGLVTFEFVRQHRIIGATMVNPALSCCGQSRFVCFVDWCTATFLQQVHRKVITNRQKRSNGRDFSANYGLGTMMRAPEMATGKMRKTMAVRGLAVVLLGGLVLGGCMQSTVEVASDANLTPRDRKLLAAATNKKPTIPEPSRRDIVA